MKTAGTLAVGLIAAASATPLADLIPRADTSGCGKNHNSGFNADPNSHTIVSGGRNRTYAIRVPDGYNDDPNKQRKVIFDFHGRKGSPSGQYNNSRYDTYNAGKEYIAVYPAGVEAAWQGAPYAVDGVDDVQFVHDLLARIRTQYCVDSNHVYASGKSNGGGFVDTLACSDVGDEFAAFAMAASALYTDNSLNSCKKRRAILQAHGDKDSTVPYAGQHTKAGGDEPNIAEWVTWWGQRDGCAADAKVVTKETGYDITTYSCNGLKDVVKHYQVYELGHCWPSSTGDNTDGARSYCKDHSLDFTPNVLDFFAKWDLTNAPSN